MGVLLVKNLKLIDKGHVNVLILRSLIRRSIQSRHTFSKRTEMSIN